MVRPRSPLKSPTLSPRSNNQFNGRSTFMLWRDLSCCAQAQSNVDAQKKEATALELLRQDSTLAIGHNRIQKLTSRIYDLLFESCKGGTAYSQLR